MSTIPPIEWSIAQWFATLGVGGVLAGVMFMFYRVDRKESEKRLAALGKEFKEIVQRNTEALTRLTSFLQSNGH